MINCVIILGPTASGKTALAVELAKKLNTEIINADSMQIYKELNIGTAKPDKAEQQGVKHHLLDFLPPTASFSVSDFKAKALKIINKLHKQNKIPVIVGGTGFYIESLLVNLTYGNTYKNDEIREKYMQMAKDYGNEHVHNILKQIDPVSAQNIHANNIKRVIRAIEIFEVSGQRKSELETEKVTKQQYNLEPLIIGLDADREFLYNRINKRVDLMIERGLITEVRKLWNKGYHANLQSMQGIGYKEFFPYFEGKIGLEDVISELKQVTRNYAKRQVTWFKHMEDIVLYNIQKMNREEMVQKIIKFIK